jgi:hypothetical protein
MTYDYAAAQATADRLLAKFGAVSALRRVVNSGSETEPTQTPTDYPTVAVRINLARWYPAFETNSDILRTDRLGLLSMGPLGLLGVTDATPYDFLVFNTAVGGGTVYRIIDAKPIAPAGLAAVYVLQLRI